MANLQPSPKATSKTGPLGDLSAFEKLAQDTLAFVEKKDFNAARTRITELETAWDKAEEKLQPMSPADWTAADKVIDRTLAQVRSGQPDQKQCVVTLRALLAKLSSLQKHN